MGPGFHPLIPAATYPAAAATASAAAAAAATAPAPAPADEVDVAPACANAAKLSRFQALTPAGAGLPQRKPFSSPRLLGSTPAPVRTGAHLLCAQEPGRACVAGLLMEEEGEKGGRERKGEEDKHDGTQGNPATPASRPGGIAPPQRKPFAMAVAVTPTSASRPSPATSLDEPIYVEVFFTKFSKKKKKVWEDGVLVLKQGSMELQRDDGSAVTKSNKNCSKGNAPPEIGSILFLGSFEVTAVLPPLLPSCSLF